MESSAENFHFERTEICDEVPFCRSGASRRLQIYSRGALCASSIITCGGETPAVTGKRKVLFVSMDPNLWMYLSYKISACTAALIHMNVNTCLCLFVALLAESLGVAALHLNLRCFVPHFVMKRKGCLWMSRGGGAGCYEFITGAGNEAAASRGQQPPLAFARSSLVSDKLPAFKKRKKKSMKNIDDRIGDCANL